MAWYRDWRHIEWIGYHHSPDNTTEDHMSDQAPEPVTTQPEDDNPGDLVGQELVDGLDSDGVPAADVEVRP